jgi:hypothetical protein
MMRRESGWKPVPKGFRIVWRPRGSNGQAGAEGEAAFAQQVDLRGVTVVGERSYGGLRFALVVLNQTDARSYRALSDEVGTYGEIARQVEARAAGGAPRRTAPEAPQPLQLEDLLLPGRSRARR